MIAFDIFLRMVKLLFKTPSKEQPFELDIDIAQVVNVEQLKQKVADHASSSVPNIKLIHKGTYQQIQGKYSRMTSRSPHSTSSMEKPSTLSSRPQKQKSQHPTHSHPPIHLPHSSQIIPMPTSAQD